MEIDIVTDIPLHSISPKAYRYLRSISTPKMAVTFFVGPGTLTDIVTLTKQNRITKQEERLCVLSFGEVNISNRLDIDKNTQERLNLLLAAKL